MGAGCALGLKQEMYRQISVNLLPLACNMVTVSAHDVHETMRNFDVCGGSFNYGGCVTSDGGGILEDCGASVRKCKLKLLLRV